MAQQERRRPTRKRKTETIPESTVEQPKTKPTAPTVTPSAVASGHSREPGPSLTGEASETKANESKNPPEKGPSKTSTPRVRKPQTDCPVIDYDSVVVLGSGDVQYKAAAIGRYAKEVARLLEDGVGVARTAGSEVDLLRGAIVDATLSRATCRGKDAPLKRGQIGRCYEAILKLMGPDGTFSKSGSAEGLKRLADRLVNLAAMPDPAPVEPIVREMRRLAQGGWTNHDHVLLRSAAALYMLLAARGNLGIDQAVRKAMTSLEHLSLGRHNDQPDMGDLIEAAEVLRRAHCEKTINEVLADPDLKALPARLRRLLQIVDFQQFGSDTRDRLASIHITMAGLWWALHEARDRGPIEIWTDLRQRGFDLELLSDLESGHRRLDRIIEGQGTADDGQALLMLADVLDSLMDAESMKHITLEVTLVPEDSDAVHENEKESVRTSRAENGEKPARANHGTQNNTEEPSPDVAKERSEQILGPMFDKAFGFREHWRERVKEAVDSLTSWIEQSEKGRCSSVAPFPYMEPDVRKPTAKDLSWMYIVVGLKLEDFIHTQDVFVPEESAWKLRYRSRWIQVSVFNMVRRWPSLTEWQAWWRFVEADLPSGKTPDTQSPFSPQELTLLTEWKQFSEKCHQSGERPTVKKFCQNRRMSDAEKDDFRRLKDKARKHAK
jgi:hypothetical protein